MRTLAMALLILMLSAIAPAIAGTSETWTHASLMDSQCSVKFKAKPDGHPTQCALQCVKSGYGILDAGGDFLAFDAAGNALALAALKATQKTDHLRVTVTGTRDGKTIKVATLSMDE